MGWTGFYEALAGHQRRKSVIGWFRRWWMEGVTCPNQPRPISRRYWMPPRGKRPWPPSIHSLISFDLSDQTHSGRLTHDTTPTDTNQTRRLPWNPLKLRRKSSGCQTDPQSQVRWQKWEQSRWVVLVKEKHLEQIHSSDCGFWLV